MRTRHSIQPKIRLLEWLFAIVGVTLVVVALLIRLPWYGTFLAFPLTAAGLLAIARDTEPHSPNWGFLTWGSFGGVVGVNLFNLAFGITAHYPLLWGTWGTALAFLLAALLADYRRGRLQALVVSLLAAVMEGFLSFYFLVAVLRAFSSH